MDRFSRGAGLGQDQRPPSSCTAHTRHRTRKLTPSSRPQPLNCRFPNCPIPSWPHQVIEKTDHRYRYRRLHTSPFRPTRPHRRPFPSPIFLKAGASRWRRLRTRHRSRIAAPVAARLGSRRARPRHPRRPPTTQTRCRDREPAALDRTSLLKTMACETHGRP